MVKNKQLRARVDDELYERVQLKTDKVSDFVREAVEEKLDKEEYGDQSTIAVDIKQLEVLIQSRQTIITQYEDLIEKEKIEIERLQAEIKDKQKSLERHAEMEENINNNPETRKIFQDAVTFLLRKKYLKLDANVDTVLSNKAKEANYNNAKYFREDLRKFIQNECIIGKTFNTNGTIRKLIQEDIDYMINRVSA